MPRRFHGKVFRPVRDRTRTGRDKINNQQLPGCLRNWWQSKLDRGVFFQYPEMFQPEQDYEGREDWPDRVAFPSLHADFVTFAGKDVTCSHAQFVYYLHKYTPLLAGTPKQIKILRTDESLLWKSSRTFIEIPRGQDAKLPYEARTASDRRGDRPEASQGDTYGTEWSPI